MIKLKNIYAWNYNNTIHHNFMNFRLFWLLVLILSETTTTTYLKLKSESNMMSIWFENYISFKTFANMYIMIRRKWAKWLSHHNFMNFRLFWLLVSTLLKYNHSLIMKPGLCIIFVWQWFSCWSRIRTVIRNSTLTITELIRCRYEFQSSF